MMDRDRFIHYEFNNKIIDDDHWNIFQLIDNITICVLNKNFTEANELLTELLNLIIAHDINELELMTKYEYPYIKFHLLANRHLVELVRQLSFRTEHVQLTTHDLGVFENSLVRHIDHHDFQMMNYINNAPKK